jgi:hypothetical protein
MKTVRLRGQDYYVGTRLQGRLLAFHVDAFSQELFVEVEARFTYQRAAAWLLPFQAFLKLMMCQEALAEARRYRRSSVRRPVYESSVNSLSHDGRKQYATPQLNGFDAQHEM